ncbi:MAG: hypothetical protein ACE5K4_06340 [Candidatus Hydrothermarchaeota archaeon]
MKITNLSKIILFSIILSILFPSLTSFALENQSNLIYPQVNLKMDRKITVVDEKVITEEKVRMKNTGLEDIEGRYWTFSLNSEDVKIYDSIGELPTRRNVGKEGIDIICTFRYPLKHNDTYTYTIKETRRDILVTSKELKNYIESLKNKYEKGEISEEVYKNLTGQYEEILKHENAWILYNWISTIYPFPTYDVTTKIILPKEAIVLSVNPKPQEVKKEDGRIVITYKRDYIPPGQNPPIKIVFKAPLSLSIAGRVSSLKFNLYFILSLFLIAGVIFYFIHKKRMFGGKE